MSKVPRYDRRRSNRTDRERFGFLSRNVAEVSRGTVVALAIAVLGMVCMAVGLCR